MCLLLTCSDRAAIITGAQQVARPFHSDLLLFTCTYTLSLYLSLLSFSLSLPRFTFSMFKVTATPHDLSLSGQLQHVTQPGHGRKTGQMKCCSKGILRFSSLPLYPVLSRPVWLVAFNKTSLSVLEKQLCLIKVCGTWRSLSTG